MEDLPSKESTGYDWPPGTVRIKDVATSKTILIPRPSSDPNQPLVSGQTSSRNEKMLILVELEHQKKGLANGYSLRLHDTHLQHVSFRPPTKCHSL